MFDDIILPDNPESPEAPEIESIPDPIQASPAESNKEHNMRALREAKERAERDRDELHRRLQEVEQRARQPEPEEEDSLHPEDLVSYKTLQKKYRKLESEIKNVQSYTHATTVEARLRSEYPDFDKVVNQENIQLLRETYPQIAQTINDGTDMYSKASTAYTFIKKFGIGAEDPYAAEKERAQKNAAKPRPMTSISPQQGDSPLSNANAFANGLTDDLKKQLLKEMNELRKGY